MLFIAFPGSTNSSSITSPNSHPPQSRTDWQNLCEHSVHIMSSARPSTRSAGVAMLPSEKKKRIRRTAHRPTNRPFSTRICIRGTCNVLLGASSCERQCRQVFRLTAAAREREKETTTTRTTKVVASMWSCICIYYADHIHTQTPTQTQCGHA